MMQSFLVPLFIRSLKPTFPHAGPFPVSPNSLGTYKHIISSLNWRSIFLFSLKHASLSLSFHFSSSHSCVHQGSPKRCRNRSGKCLWIHECVCLCVEGASFKQTLLFSDSQLNHAMMELKRRCAMPALWRMMGRVVESIKMSKRHVLCGTTELI